MSFGSIKDHNTLYTLPDIHAWTRLSAYWSRSGISGISPAEPIFAARAYSGVFGQLAQSI